jgi:hypothetical protein
MRIWVQNPAQGFRIQLCLTNQFSVWYAYTIESYFSRWICNVEKFNSLDVQVGFAQCLNRAGVKPKFIENNYQKLFSENKKNFISMKNFKILFLIYYLRFPILGTARLKEILMHVVEITRGFMQFR